MAKAQLGFTTKNGMSGGVRSIGAGHPQAALEAATRCCVNTPALSFGLVVSEFDLGAAGRRAYTCFKELLEHKKEVLFR